MLKRSGSNDYVEKKTMRFGFVKRLAFAAMFGLAGLVGGLGYSNPYVQAGIEHVIDFLEEVSGAVDYRKKNKEIMASRLRALKELDPQKRIPIEKVNAAKARHFPPGVIRRFDRDAVKGYSPGQICHIDKAIDEFHKVTEAGYYNKHHHSNQR